MFWQNEMPEKNVSCSNTSPDNKNLTHTYFITTNCFYSWETLMFFVQVGIVRDLLGKCEVI